MLFENMWLVVAQMLKELIPLHQSCRMSLQGSHRALPDLKGFIHLCHVSGKWASDPAFGPEKNPGHSACGGARDFGLSGAVH